jgi:hypothetical protein
MGRLRVIIVALILAAFLTTSATAEKRVALVIGNSAYQYTGALKNPKNDASDMAAALKKRDFRVIEGFDLNKTAMDGKINRSCRCPTCDCFCARI